MNNTKTVWMLIIGIIVGIIVGFLIWGLPAGEVEGKRQTGTGNVVYTAWVNLTEKCVFGLDVNAPGVQQNVEGTPVDCGEAIGQTGKYVNYADICVSTGLSYDKCPFDEEL